MNGLQELIQTDERIVKLSSYGVVRKEKDPLHLERRQQQRAISEYMMALCLTYGKKRWIRGSLTYTLLDKSLVNTPYQKYIDKIRGLRVVLNKEKDIHTVYWVDKLR